MVSGHVLGKNGAIMMGSYNGVPFQIVGKGGKPNKYKPHQGAQEVARRSRRASN